jgi:hypothetical protein
MPAEWQSRERQPAYKSVGKISRGATIDTEQYRFAAVAPSSYSSTGWERFSRDDDPLVTTLRTGLTGYDTYALAITPRGRLAEGEAIDTAARRLSPQINFGEVPGRKGCVQTSAQAPERSSTDSLLIVAYCVRERDIFEVALSWRSLRLRMIELGPDDPALTSMRESMTALMTSFRFK